MRREVDVVVNEYLSLQPPLESMFDWRNIAGYL